jgi:NADPH-dependent F420 reductase
MKIGIIGSGNMGSGLARRITHAGHDVVMTARDLANAEKVARHIGPRVKVVSPADIAKGVDIVIAATPAREQVYALKSCGDLTGKIVIDITNPLKDDMSGLSIGFTTSFAEEVAKALPGVKVVKAFNTVFAQVLNDGPDFGHGIRASAYYCGDDETARKTVQQLIESMGFDAIDTGPLANARYLEPMGMLNIWLGYRAKRGTGIALNLVTREKAAAKSVRAA